MTERKTRGRGRPALHDWDKYADGQLWVLYQGEDFHCELASFRALVHRTAQARGMNKETSIDKNARSVSFRIFD